MPDAATQNKDTVDLQCSAYLAMASKWALIDALLGGTLAMRAAGPLYLPQEPRESNEAYKCRLNRSVLYNGYADAVDTMVSKPFSKAVTLQGDLPEQLKDIADDVNGEGQDINQFAQEICTEAINRGLTHILVDYPVTVKEDGTTPTLAEERQNGIRPRFIHVRPPQLIGWRTVAGADGTPVLSEIRIKETAIEPKDRYGEQTVDYVRLYTTTTWELHRKAPGDQEYTLYKSGTHSFGAVPLVTIYLERSGLMTAEPPMEDLAWMNLAHWQSYSDQRNILRFARTGLIFASGLSDDEMEKQIVVGPNSVFKSTNENAKMVVVEHSGAAIDAGRQDIQDIEERMVVLGLQPYMVKKSTSDTATGQSINEDGANSSVHAWIRQIEAGIEQAYEMAAKWTGATLPEKFTVDIYDDFGLTVRAATDIDALIKSRQAGELSRQTFLQEIKRRGVISDTVSVDEEIGRIEAEGPSMADIIGDLQPNGGQSGGNGGDGNQPDKSGKGGMAKDKGVNNG